MVRQVSFEVNIIKPFDGVTLEVGGAVVTYWKTTASPISSTPSQPSISGGFQHPCSAETSPSNYSVTSPARHGLTVSSLAGNYVYAVIQVTRDLHPVICFDW